MPRATEHPTPSRRVFIGAATIGLLAGGSVATLAAPPSRNPDAELIAACATFQACQAQIDVLNREGCDEQVMAEECDAWNEALASIVDRKAQTREGLRAQARAAITALRVAVGVSQYESWDDRAEPHDHLVMAVLSRLAEEG